MSRQMWYNVYKDYKKDRPTKKEKREPRKGIVGCEMHEVNGWGEMFDEVKDAVPRRKPPRS